MILKQKKDSLTGLPLSQTNNSYEILIYKKKESGGILFTYALVQPTTILSLKLIL